MGCVLLSATVSDTAVNLCTSVCVDMVLSSECVHRAGAAGWCGDMARDILKWAQGTPRQPCGGGSVHPHPRQCCPRWFWIWAQGCGMLAH